MFFYLNTFVAEVKTSFVASAGFEASSCKLQHLDIENWGFKYLGLLSIAGDVNPLSWAYYARTALFKDIDIILLHPTNSWNGNARHESAVLSLRWGETPRISTHVTSNSARNHFEKQHLSEMLDRAGTTMRHFISGDYAQGLSFRHLEAAVSTFRVEQGKPKPSKRSTNRTRRIVRNAPAMIPRQSGGFKRKLP